MKEADCYPGCRVGRLVLLSRHRVQTKSYGNRWEWICKCDCGRIINVLTFRLGSIVDCGNHTKEKLSANGKKGKKPLTKLKDSNLRSPYRRLYLKWHDMVARCNNPKNVNYKYYGGRGIKVTSDWLDYKAFKSWALSQGYDINNKDSKEQTLDRIDVNDNYKPSNCRLVSTKIQNMNKRNNIFVTYNHQKKTLSEWSKQLGINRNTLQSRYDRGLRGKALLDTNINHVPSKHKGKMIKFCGNLVSYYELAKKYNLDYGTIKYRYEHLNLRDKDLVKSHISNKK